MEGEQVTVNKIRGAICLKSWNST